METSQMFCFENQLTGFHMIATLMAFNELSQCKRIKSLLFPQKTAKNSSFPDAIWANRS